MKIFVKIQEQQFNTENETKKLCEGNKNIGGVVCFTGICRDENEEIEALVLEHYPEMAEKQMERIAKQASERWGLNGISIVHRFGKIVPGENIVMVATAAQHRHAAFEAAQFTMDFLKTDAPFWKKEIKKNAEQWVESKKKDKEAKSKWG